MHIAHAQPSPVQQVSGMPMPRPEQHTVKTAKMRTATQPWVRLWPQSVGAGSNRVASLGTRSSGDGSFGTETLGVGSCCAWELVRTGSSGAKPLGVECLGPKPSAEAATHSCGRGGTAICSAASACAMLSFAERGARESRPGTGSLAVRRRLNQPLTPARRTTPASNRIQDLRLSFLRRRAEARPVSSTATGHGGHAAIGSPGWSWAVACSRAAAGLRDRALNAPGPSVGVGRSSRRGFTWSAPG